MSRLFAFSDWLSHTHISQSLGSHEWLLPVVQSVHILAIAILMTSMAMFSLRLAGFIAREQPLRQVQHRFLPPAWVALVVLALTGLIMIIGEPQRELANWVFWLKMALIAIAIAVTLGLRALLEDKGVRSMSLGKGNVVRAGAIALLVVWVAVLTCGRWIAYAQ